MHPLLSSLSGGDRRSIGESNRAVSTVLESPELISVLFQGVETDDPVLRMRCTDAIEKVTTTHPRASGSIQECNIESPLEDRTT